LVQEVGLTVRSLQNSRVLVTGAGGFLACHIIPELLDGGAEVIGIDLKDGLDNGNLSSVKSKVKLIEADITNLSALERLGVDCDYVVHLAAIGAPALCDRDPEKAFLTNIQGTFNILKLSTRKGVKRVLFSSSAHVYGISPKYIPTDERHPLALQDTYTTTKVIGESLCQLFYSNHNLEYITTRLFNSYGPRQSTDYFIPAMIAKAKTGRIELRDRHVTKDFVYVEDVAEVFVKALASEYVGEINIGSGVQTRLQDVAKYIADAFKAELTFSNFETGGPTHMQCDTTRASRILGWKAVTPMEAGLDKTIAALRR